MSGPEGTPNGVDRLAHIEAWATASVAYHPYRDDVLALVEIAKAARDTGWRDADGRCWCEKSVEITRAPHRPQCLRMRSALARLDSGATEGDA